MSWDIKILRSEARIRVVVVQIKLNQLEPISSLPASRVAPRSGSPGYTSLAARRVLN